jgi:hypothetical protein
MESIFLLQPLAVMKSSPSSLDIGFSQRLNPCLDPTFQPLAEINPSIGFSLWLNPNRCPLQPKAEEQAQLRFAKNQNT